MATNSAFLDLLHEVLIPEFCSHPGKGCEPSGFRPDSVRVSDEDARYFLMAYDAGLIEHQGQGHYRAAASAASEQFFWEGRRALGPRPFTLWLEPIITVAGLARLHFDHRWPKDRIGMQSADWAFDLVAFLSDGANEYVAAEVKKTTKEITELIELMKMFGMEPGLPEPRSGKARNAWKKMAALRRRRPPLFWALGPDGVSHAFEVSCRSGDVIELLPTGEDALDCPETTVIGI